MKSKVEAIRAFLAAGYAVIPLCSPTVDHEHFVNGKRTPCMAHKGKVPTEGAWEATPVGKYDEKTISEKNYGVVLGPTDIVIDVDPRNYKAGEKPLEALAKKIGGIPAGTLVTRTGGGGLHIFLKKPADVSVRNALEEFAGVEFKAGPGRQVVGPGSIHGLSQKEYRHLQGSPASVAQAPAKLLDLIKRSAVAFSGHSVGEYQDDDATRERCAGYLRALAPAIQGFQGDDATFKAALGLRDRGVSPRVAFDLLSHHYNPRCAPPWEDDELAAKVQHAYAYAKGAVGSAHPAAHFTPIKEVPAGHDPSEAEIGASGWKLDNKKQPVKAFQNLLNYFSLSAVKLRGCFGYNEFARRVEIVGATPWGAAPGLPVTDIDLQRMRAHLARNHGYDASVSDLVDGMVDVSQRRRFHPVKAYLGELKWDGVCRLDSWLAKYLGVEDLGDGYVPAVGRKTLVAAVARIYEPGIKFDHVLVLEGRQNLGKSGVCKVLGGEWFSDFKMNVGEKDTIQMMQGKWIVEMAELHATRQADMDMVKAFLTRAVDEARFSYGRLPGRYPRQGIFIATYNPGADGTYLKDDENRRWWPVRCNAVGGARTFDFAGLKAVRDQLWAEAVVLYRKGEPLTMETAELQDAAKVAQDLRRAEHPWAERVGEWLVQRDANVETRADFYTGREVFIGAMHGMDSRYHRREQNDVARAMRELGWEVGNRRVSGELTRGYWRPGAVRPQGGRPTLEKEILDIFGDLV